MFTKQFDQIFTKEKLLDAYTKINKTSAGMDDISFMEFEEKLEENITKLHKRLLTSLYTPEPLKQIKIPKEDKKELREIAISSIKDKIVQRVLYDELEPYFEEFFSNKSYAYRKNKSTINAINRVSEFIKKENKNIILKSDIENFFENIDHDILLNLLKKHIRDKKIIELIQLFLKIGAFFKFDYLSHMLGVHQGDILSPLLSNIYLNEMDQFLEKNSISFVRYGDDFIILTKSKDEAIKIKNRLEDFLDSIKLQLNREKTYISDIKKGFSFLGVTFKDKQKFIENERFQKSISKLHSLSKNKKSFNEFVKDINYFLYATKNYYLKIIQNNQKQLNILKKHIQETISQKIYFAKLSKEIKNKKDFKKILKNIKFELLFDDKDETIEFIIALGYERYSNNKNEKGEKKLKKKITKYTKNIAKDSTLHINDFGIALGFSKNKFVIKKYGKIQKSFPLNSIKRIILEGKGYTISSEVIKVATKEGIYIDFIDHNFLPYASLITYKASLSQMIHKQAMILNTKKHIKLASAFLKSKSKNQLNYLKYQNRYHKTLDTHIEKIEKIIPKIKLAKSIDEMMGYEGSISAIYWDGVKTFLDANFEKRVTYKAKDIVNSSLNYGYAILYGTIQKALVKAGLSLNISFLHSLDEQKPTLTFDLIEEFRTYVVDKTIFAMINKDEKITLNKEGLLTKESRYLISKNVKERLGSYVKWKKSYRQLENIIQIQAYHLAQVVKNPSLKYKSFIGKY